MSTSIVGLCHNDHIEPPEIHELSQEQHQVMMGRLSKERRTQNRLPARKRTKPQHMRMKSQNGCVNCFLFSFGTKVGKCGNNPSNLFRKIYFTSRPTLEKLDHPFRMPQLCVSRAGSATLGMALNCPDSVECVKNQMLRDFDVKKSRRGEKSFIIIQMD